MVAAFRGVRGRGTRAIEGCRPHVPYRVHLDVIRVTEPCRESCDGVDGHDRVRFCSTCRRNVYDVRHIAPGELESLLRFHEGQAVVRFEPRADGTCVVAGPMTCSQARVASRKALRGRMVEGGTTSVAVVVAVLAALSASASQMTLRRSQREGAAAPPGERTENIPGVRLLSQERCAPDPAEWPGDAVTDLLRSNSRFCGRTVPESAPIYDSCGHVGTVDSRGNIGSNFGFAGLGRDELDDPRVAAFRARRAAFLREVEDANSTVPSAWAVDEDVVRRAPKTRGRRE
jgi:hypothetical protein